MTANDGRHVLLKLGDGATPAENFTTIGGLRANQLVIENVLLDASTLASGAWRQLNASTGQQTVTLSGRGHFTDSVAEALLRGDAFTHAVRNYELHFSDGDIVRGPFQIRRYEREGQIGEEEAYNLTLESAGPIVVITAP